MKESEKPAGQEADKPESIWWNLGLNLVLPIIVLRQGDRFIANDALVLAVALAFPVAYFLYDLKERGKKNLISVIGFASVLLTGGIGLLELPRFWIIVKETAIPAIIGLAVLISLYTPFPLVRAILFSPQVFDVERIQQALEARRTTARFERMLRLGTVFLALSFFLSATLNYFVAVHFIQTEPSLDRAQFNREVGEMMTWSLLVIALPSMLVTVATIFYVVRGIRLCTGLALEDAMAPQHRQ
ncbi:MAG: VC0807 family protein [Opitutales bacterium]